MSVNSLIQNRIIKPLKVFTLDCKNKNVKLGFNRVLASFFHGTGIAISAGKRCRTIVKETLEKEYADILKKYNNYSAKTSYDPQAPVWVLWLQGYDNAPPIVKKCIDSIKAGTSHPVHLLTSDNISDYIALPDYITEKYSKGIITHAQMSDIIRMSLLAEYGGIWIDATVYVPIAIPESVFQGEFYTCKRKSEIEDYYISGYKWTSFINGCQKGCVIQIAMRELFFEYWKKNDYLIDYLLVDFFMLAVYNNISYAKELIDNLPYNQPQLETLQEIMSQPYNEQKYKEITENSNTDMFKLSWRMNFKKETENGQQTFFGHFLEDRS